MLLRCRCREATKLSRAQLWKEEMLLSHPTMKAKVCIDKLNQTEIFKLGKSAAVKMWPSK